MKMIWVRLAKNHSRGAHPPGCGFCQAEVRPPSRKTWAHRNPTCVRTNPARALPGKHTRLGCGFSRPRGKRGRTVTDQASIAAPHASRRDACYTRDARPARVPRTFFYSCSFVVKQLVADQINTMPANPCVSGLRDLQTTVAGKVWRSAAVSQTSRSEVASQKAITQPSHLEKANVAVGENDGKPPLSKWFAPLSAFGLREAFGLRRL